MPRMRYVLYQVLMDIPATDVLVVEASGLLRDILPDQAFKIHSLQMGFSASIGAGDRATMTLAKNIAIAPVVVSGALTTLHGVLARWMVDKVVASPAMEAFHHFVSFPEPLDFDKDDSLNLRIDGANSEATAQQVTAAITIVYQAS